MGFCVRGSATMSTWELQEKLGSSKQWPNEYSGARKLLLRHLLRRPSDSLALALDYVSLCFRYVPISLGVGAYVSKEAETRKHWGLQFKPFGIKYLLRWRLVQSNWQVQLIDLYMSVCLVHTSSQNVSTSMRLDRLGLTLPHSSSDNKQYKFLCVNQV